MDGVITLTDRLVTQTAVLYTVGYKLSSNQLANCVNGPCQQLQEVVVG